MSFRGTFINGRVELEPGVSLPEGTPLRIEPLRRRKTTKALKGGGPGLASLARFSVKTGIRSVGGVENGVANGEHRGALRKRRAGARPGAVDPAYRLSDLAVDDGGPSDLALEHDHYLYGTPKRYTRAARRSPAKRTPRPRR